MFLKVVQYQWQSTMYEVHNFFSFFPSLSYIASIWVIPIFLQNMFCRHIELANPQKSIFNKKLCTNVMAHNPKTITLKIILLSLSEFLLQKLIRGKNIVIAVLSFEIEALGFFRKCSKLYLTISRMTDLIHNFFKLGFKS